MRGLAAMGATVDFLVPNRFEFGYGLTPEIVALAAARRPKMIITVDNGIASVEGVAAAHAMGIDVLITDHHLPGERLPEPSMDRQPKPAGLRVPEQASGRRWRHVLRAVRFAGTAARARAISRNRAEPRLADLLDLVALGTIADVVRLDHVNRILVDQGLRRIRADRMQPGVRALLAIAGRAPHRATSYDLGFIAGPRLNAAGRLADMSVGIACLMSDEQTAADRIAAELDALNRERREVEATMQEQALADMECVVDESGCTLCLYRAEWHQGVVGIVASRLKDRYHRPVIVFAPAGSDGELRGSGRAIAGFHLRDALDLVAKRAPGTISRFGGHAYAAGLSLHERALPRFTEEFERIGREWLSPALLKRTIETDGALSASELTLGLAQSCAAHVWGQGFPPPAFDAEFTVTAQRVVGDKHLKLALSMDERPFDAIAVPANRSVAAAHSCRVPP